eukprot:Blabericola_migrator_1__9638@NODE_526_length_7839_cov_99_241251_g402_i0_p10_GENE_NODE_526_length_7839_cov_99_241251_g402_i0NODE_526_length_7839_cov_99_241251_g402_i0_p10_ORF_typecomplete_len117_score15_02_NODE_526_length_7839_cov_99_241251_g402_i023182668
MKKLISERQMSPSRRLSSNHGGKSVANLHTESARCSRELGLNIISIGDSDSERMATLHCRNMMYEHGIYKSIKLLGRPMPFYLVKQNLLLVQNMEHLLSVNEDVDIIFTNQKFEGL